MNSRPPGVPISKASKELRISYNTVKGLINRGELKLNDNDWIDDESWNEYYSEWMRRPEWMRR
jgi:hypothetical protein